MVIMLGEVEYDDLYYQKKETFNINISALNDNTQINIEQQEEGQPFPITAHLFVLAAIFMVSIIVMNLLVGLAVNDIQGLRETASLRHLVQQV